MQKTLIEQDGLRSYMILQKEQEEDAFWYKMLEQNQIQGMLAISVRVVDNHRQYCYDVTGMQSLQSYGEGHSLDYPQLKKILESIAGTIAKASEFLLSENGYLVSAEQIFIDAFCNVWLGYFEEQDETLEGRLQMFAEYLLGIVDHQDRKAGEFVYHFYDEMMETASLQALQNFLGKYEEEKKTGLQSQKFLFQSKEKSRDTDEEKGREKEWYLAWQQDMRKGILRFFCGSKSVVLIELSKFPCTVGRDAMSDYCIRNMGVSRSHFRIEKKKEKLYITDLHSHNGTWLNGKKLKAGVQTRLKTGDRIMVAGEVYRLQVL